MRRAIGWTFMIIGWVGMIYSFGYAAKIVIGGAIAHFSAPPPGSLD